MTGGGWRVRWNRRTRRTVAVLAVGALAVGVADVAAVATGVQGHHHTVATAMAPSPATAAAVDLPDPPPLVVPASTTLATPRGTVPLYTTPGGPQTGTVGTWYGYDLVLPVIGTQGSMLHVRLPWRPNESTGWVQADTVTQTTTPYYLVVNLTSTHLMVFKHGVQIMRFPVGVGLPATPTVTGHYFVAVHEPKGNSLYGPVILDLSAHSDVIQNWEGSGDAIAAIHGPIDATADREIGTTGARVSNGCIRLHLADVEQLAGIPVGTPVLIDP